MSVTSRADAEALFQRRQDPLVSAMIAHVEEQVAKSFVPGRTMIIYPEQIRGAEGRSYSERDEAARTVAALYRASGWRFELKDSQRDGAWWELS